MTNHTNFIASNLVEKKSEIDITAYVHFLASVMGNVCIGKNVVVAAAASIRADEGQPIWVGDDTNIQGGVVLHALETCEDMQVREAAIEVADICGIYIGDRVSIAPKSQVYGPTKIGSDTFIGTQSLIFKATIGSNCVVEPKAAIMEVSIPDGRYVPADSVITSQGDANHLPFIDDVYRLKDLNKAVVGVNVQTAKAYRKNGTSSNFSNHPCVKVEYCLSFSQSMHQVTVHQEKVTVGGDETPNLIKSFIGTAYCRHSNT